MVAPYTQSNSTGYRLLPSTDGSTLLRTWQFLAPFAITQALSLERPHRLAGF